MPSFQAQALPCGKDRRARNVIGTTLEDGQYQVENLEPGAYELEVRASGFRTELRRLTLRVGDNVTINIELKVGRISEQVKSHRRGFRDQQQRLQGRWKRQPRSNRELAAQRPKLPRAFQFAARLEF
jgi:Carboxypeptidase regulatory-like domain